MQALPASGVTGSWRGLKLTDNRVTRVQFTALGGRARGSAMAGPGEYTGVRCTQEGPPARALPALLNAVSAPALTARRRAGQRNSQESHLAQPLREHEIGKHNDY